MTITYSVAIDTGDDGDFGAPDNDITPDVLHLQWRLGMTDPYQTTAPPAAAVITLDNRAGRYSPERTPVVIGQQLRIQSHDGTLTRTHFIGHIQHIDPQTGTLGSQHARLYAPGIAQQWQGQRIRLDINRDQYSDDVIRTILQQVRIRYPALAGYCLLDRDGHNEINNTFVFPQDPLTRNFDIGKSRFGYVGDTWREGIAADDAIAQVMQVEDGRFYVARDGTVRLHNRHRLLMDSTIKATFTDDMDDAIYSYSDRLLNRIEVRVTPRTLGAPNSPVWRLTDPLQIEPGRAQSMTVHFRNADDTPIGAQDIILPEAGLHYLADTRPDGNGQDVTDRVTVALREMGYSAAVLEIWHALPYPVFLTMLELRGTPVIIRDELLLTIRDDLSRSLYGDYTATIHTPLITDALDATALAQTRINRQAYPRGTLHELHLSTRTQPQHVLACTLFDAIAIQESQTGHDATYFIIGEDHTVQEGGADHRVRWLLEPAPLTEHVIIGSSSIDDSNRRLLPR